MAVWNSCKKVPITSRYVYLRSLLCLLSNTQQQTFIQIYRQPFAPNNRCDDGQWPTPGSSSGNLVVLTNEWPLERPPTNCHELFKNSSKSKESFPSSSSSPQPSSFLHTLVHSFLSLLRSKPSSNTYCQSKESFVSPRRRYLSSARSAVHPTPAVTESFLPEMSKDRRSSSVLFFLSRRKVSMQPISPSSPGSPIVMV